MKNFWQEMKLLDGGPILCLAPMANVTDSAFRYIIAKYSKCPKSFLQSDFLRRDLRNFTAPFGTYVTYTEFVSADGLCLAPDAGCQKLLKDLEYSEIERPIVAQLFGSNPETIEKAAQIVAELGFDGIDINMGCPDKSVEKQGAGAALIKNPKLAKEIIAAAKHGVYKDDHCTKKKCGIIPVSVKIRLGYNKDELEAWLPELLTENPAAIIIHARTRKEMSKVPARWERIKRAVEIRDGIQTSPPTILPPALQTLRVGLDLGMEEINSNSANLKSPFLFAGKMRQVDKVDKTLIIGNGDIKNVNDAMEKCRETGADGAMLGRAIFGKPWLLSSSYQWFNEKNNPEVVKKILEILMEHTKLFEEKFFSCPEPSQKVSGIKNFAIMKKHFKSYLSGLSNTKGLEDKLMETQNAKEVEELISKFLSPII